ncbi:unnamed protein product [Ceutorhynchus assimilis]|uniref:MADF domain-containing protein n=1 Tax=Ceutorhynchus assimilis TaxID=467358 RepID=A0A9N9Q8H8_9CUCU|nr:unnamed protein product [Ceutorhynchus assimilis]
MDSHFVIKSVSKNKVLYDPKYNRTTERKQAWIEVGVELNQDVELVKRKWKNIRDEYVKFVGGLSKARNYGLASQMEFLNPYLHGVSLKGKKAHKIKHEKADKIKHESDVENYLPDQSLANPKSSPDTLNGLDLIFLGVSNLKKTYPQDAKESQEPAEALCSLDEVDQTCSQITNVIKQYAQSKPNLVNRKINNFFKAHGIDNDNQSTSDGTNILQMKFNFERRSSIDC